MTKIYLISPPKIELKAFSISLHNALKTNLVPVFQLRLKDIAKSEIKNYAKEIKKICDDNNCLFILNDDSEMALDIEAAGVHLGENDGIIKLARKNSEGKNFIIGASCYDSRHLAAQAAEDGADYLSFGAFFESSTKKSKGKPTTEIIEWSREMTDLPICAIGGINNENCKILAKVKTDFICVISYVWSHPQGIQTALKNLDASLKI